MSGFTTRGLDLILDSGFNPDSVSLHVDDPGADGGNEVRGGMPSYKRRPAAWAPASDGVRSTSVEVVFDVPQNTVPTHLGYWQRGEFLGSRPLATVEHFVSQGTLSFAPGMISEVLGG